MPKPPSRRIVETSRRGSIKRVRVEFPGYARRVEEVHFWNLARAKLNPGEEFRTAIRDETAPRGNAMLFTITPTPTEEIRHRNE